MGFLRMTCKPFPYIDLCIDQHGDKRFFMEATDQDGVPLVLSAFSEITFIISRSVNSAILLTKTLTGATITITGGGVFYFDISNVESGALPTGSLYCEVQLIATATGDQQTIGAGHFRNQNTRIGD
jgi:hypothetical protein